MNITVIGAGYVGLTISACLASMGHRVICVEKDQERLATLQQGRLSFYEPGLAELVCDGMRDHRLSMTGDLLAAVSPASIIFVAVGTPSGDSGAPDLSDLEEVTMALADLCPSGVVAIKSTVPVGTTDRVRDAIAAGNGGVGVVYNPEFLREGSAVSDFFHPSRVIIGTDQRTAAKEVASLYQPLGCPVMVTDPRTAEMIKYASNAFLATKVSFINEVASLCEQVGADMPTVAAALGADPRIGPHYLKAGVGFGGSCLPKDVRALAELAKRHALPSPMLDAVLQVNDAQRHRFVQKVETLLGGIAGRTVAVFGLAFKGGTSDVRESPALDIASRLIAKGAVVRAFDPAAEEAAIRTLPALTCCSDAYEAAAEADAILLLTDWQGFESLDWQRLRQRSRGCVVIDGRGLGVARPATDAGFLYIGPGADPRYPHDVPSRKRSSSDPGPIVDVAPDPR